MLGVIHDNIHLRFGCGLFDGENDVSLGSIACYANEIIVICQRLYLETLCHGVRNSRCEKQECSQ